MPPPEAPRSPPRGGMAAAARGGSSQPGQAAAPGGAGDSSLLGSATTWLLKRYGRFLPPADGDDEGQNTSSWKVFESNEESGSLILTIVVSGHFFISQGRTVLEGFSLIDSHKWLKIVRRADCLLLRAQSKNECRMFRVQFGGDSKEQMLEHCSNCVQKLAEYVPVEVTDEQSQKLYHSLSQQANGENEVKDTEQNASVLHIPDEPLPDSCTSLGERRSVTQLAQENTATGSSVPGPAASCPALFQVQAAEIGAWSQQQFGLSQLERLGLACDVAALLQELRELPFTSKSVLEQQPELPAAYRHSAWRAQELGPFIRLCLMDQNFPAFVEDVEKELKKLTEG